MSDAASYWQMEMCFERKVSHQEKEILRIIAVSIDLPSTRHEKCTSFNANDKSSFSIGSAVIYSRVIHCFHECINIHCTRPQTKRWKINCAKFSAVCGDAKSNVENYRCMGIDIGRRLLDFSAIPSGLYRTSLLFLMENSQVVIVIECR